jgi:hypothetical protein
MTTEARFESSACVSDAQRDELELHGHLLVRGVLTDSTLSEARAALVDYVSRRQKVLTPSERAVGASALQPTFSLSDAPAAVVRFVTSPRLGEVAARLLGVRAVRVLHFCGFFKPAGGIPTPWHQDASFIPLETDRLLSLWIPLTRVTARMGGLVFARGSHRSGMLDARHSVRQFPLARNGVLEAGDASAHLGWTLHASDRNVERSTREAIAVSYYPDGTRLTSSRKSPFAQSLIAEYFPGLEPGAIASGPRNPIVYAGPSSVRPLASVCLETPVLGPEPSHRGDST